MRGRAARIALAGLAALIAASAVGLPASAAAADAPQLRAMTYNVRGNVAFRDGEWEPEIVAQAIADQGADLVGLQEICNWQLTDMKERLGALGYQYTSHLTTVTGSTVCGGPTMQGRYGIGYLSKLPLENVQWVPLPQHNEPRVVLSATVRPGGPPVRVFNSHVSPGAGLTQTQAVAQETTRFATARKVLMADLNVQHTNTAALAPLVNLSFQEVDGAAAPFNRPTFSPRTTLDRKLDYVFVSGQVAIGETQVPGPPQIPLAASDHLPVWSQLSLGFLPQELVARIDSGPPELANEPVASLEFSSEQAGVGFECRLDSDQEAGFEPCASPLSTAALDDGTHRFEVRAVGPDPFDERGEPIVHEWTIDTVAPTVTIDSAPDEVTGSPEAGFAFSADEDPVELACRLDGGAGPEQGWQPCESPLQLTQLEPGPHRFEVRATDLAGNVGDPAAHEWTIEPEIEAPPPGDPPVGAPPVGDPRRPLLGLRVIRAGPRAQPLRPGRPLRLRVAVRNRGRAATAGRVRLCLRGPAPNRLKLRGKRCRLLPALAPGASARRVFVVRATRRASGQRLVLRFLAGSTDARQVRARATIRVR